MLTAITVLAIVFTIVAVVISSVRSTIALGGAQDEVLSVAQVVEKQIRDDLSQINHDGFMVIRAGQVIRPTETDPGNTDILRRNRMDMLGFFANGNWKSSLDPTIQSPLAFIWYGHLRNDPTVNPFTSADNFDDAPPVVDADGNYVPPHQWALGRKATLILPNIPYRPDGSQIDHTASIWRNNPLDYDLILPSQASSGDCTYEQDTPVDEATDIAIGTLDRYRSALLSSGTPRINFAYALSRRYGTRNYDITTPLANQLPLVASTFAPYCSHFEVEYAVDADNDESVDLFPRNPGDEYTAHIQWQRLNADDRDNAFGTFPDGTTEVSGGDIRVFADDNFTATTSVPAGNHLFGSGLESTTEESGIYTAWPLLLRITMVLHDAKGYLHDRHLDSVEFYSNSDAYSGYQITGEPDGQRLQLIIRVPPRPAN